MNAAREVPLARRLLLSAAVSSAIALGLLSCADEPTDSPPEVTTDLTGEWDFALALPGDEAGTCSILGSLVLTQTGTAVSGTSTVYYRFCGAQSSGEVAAGTLEGTALTFHSASCDYSGTVLGTPGDSIAGTVTCSWTSGTWTAVRVGPAAHLDLTPQGRRLVVGGSQQLTATLLDSAGHVLYGRAVEWGSSAPAAAAVSATGLVSGVGPGTADVTATAGGRSATVTFEVSAAAYVALTGGEYHTCGLTAAGTAYCWGAGGALGDGSGLQATTPVPVAGGLTFASLAAGLAHTCGVTASGAAYCWGSNGGGRLGTGDSASGIAPRAVAGALIFTSIAAGYIHTCGLTTTGAAYCWGRNDRGQLGTATPADAAVPTPVSSGLSFTSISAGWYHTCALTATGAAWCWGENGGKLGTGDTVSTTTPVAVAGALTFASISTGRLHTCGLSSSGAAYCWGGGIYGQIGDGTRATRLVPTAVAGGRAYAALSARHAHTVALTADGHVWGWGSNSVGESGDTSRTEWDVPAALNTPLLFGSLAAGGVHTCGITTAGVTYCWGYNSNGQIGDGTYTDRRSPVRVAGQP